MNTDNPIHKTDDELLEQFFAANMPQPQDDGFSQNVMRQLPQRARKMNRIWSFACALLAAAIFLLFDGIEQLRVLVWRMLGDAAGYVASIDFSVLSPVMIVLAAVVLLVVGLSNLLPTQR